LTTQAVRSSPAPCRSWPPEPAQSAAPSPGRRNSATPATFPGRRSSRGGSWRRRPRRLVVVPGHLTAPPPHSLVTSWGSRLTRASSRRPRPPGMGNRSKPPTTEPIEIIFIVSGRRPHPRLAALVELPRPAALAEAAVSPLAARSRGSSGSLQRRAWRRGSQRRLGTE
jgi:hypothetical protein